MMWNQMSLLVSSFILFSTGIHRTSGECKFEHKYVCDIQDCNCRYVSQNGVSISSFYRRFIAMFSQGSGEGQVCDKCEIFCRKEKHISCQHGVCDKDKGCICRDCWSGETCSKYQNRQPEFKRSLYVAEIKEGKNIGEEILTVSAVDSDMETCVDKSNCPCGRVKYSIKKGNEDGLFYINPDNGVVSVARELYMVDQNHPISLTIAAENEADLSSFEEKRSDKSLVTVAITVVENDVVAGRQRGSLHHRARRSVTRTYDSFEIAFAPVKNETFFPAGSTINYRLYLAHNSSASPETLRNMTIQLSSQNLELSDDGYSVNISNVDHSPASTSRTNSETVSFMVQGTMKAADYMEIKFNGSVRENLYPVALLQVAFTMNASMNSTAHVTYGPKYSTEIFTAPPETQLSRTTTGFVEPGMTLDYNINVILPDFSFTLILIITSSLNAFDFLNIEDVQVGNISSSVLPQHQNPTPVAYTGAEDNSITSRVVLNFGNTTVSVNKSQSANTINVSFSVKVHDHYLLENGSKHFIGVGTVTGKGLLVTQDSLEFRKDEPFLIAEIKALNITNPNIKKYFINDVLKFSWIVKHANASYESAENVVVLFYFPTSVVMVGITIDDGRMSDGIINETIYDGRKVLTFAHNSSNLSQSDTLRGVISVKVNNTVTPMADLNVEIQINYTTSKGEARPIRTYKPDPGYIAGVPSFSLTAPNMTINIGQTIEITLSILIKRMTLNGTVNVFLPVHAQSNSTIMRFIKPESFNTISYVGSNVEAATNFTGAKPIFRATTNDTEYCDTAELHLGLLENKDVSTVATDVPLNNTLTLKFKVVLEDNVYVENLGNYTIHAGLKSGENAVWVGQTSLTASVPSVRQPKLHITPLSNGSESLVQGSIVEYNFTISHKNDSDAHALNVQVLWMLPTYCKFRRVLVNYSHPQFRRLGDNVMFTFKKVDFGEKPFVSFSVAMDPDKVRTKTGKNYAVTPVSLVYQNKRSFFEPLIPLSVAFTVPSKQAVPAQNAPELYIYNRGYLVDNSSSTIYICSVTSQRNRPSCLWTNTKGASWQAVHPIVINIIGIDHAKKIVYGIGNNKMAYMKYIKSEEKWYSILPKSWKLASAALSDKKIVVVEDGYANEADPTEDKEHNIENGEKWGANKLGVYHFSSANGWQQKASWNCFY